MAPAIPKVSIGTVVDFDRDRGLGTVSGDIMFHVIEIADGSRTVDVGQRVAWLPSWRFGKLEASHLVKLQD